VKWRQEKEENWIKDFRADEPNKEMSSILLKTDGFLPDKVIRLCEKYD